jgi:integrase
VPLARNWSVATWHGLPNCRPGSQAWSADEAQAFLRTTQNGAAVPAFIFLFVYGMRRGEVLGLRWREIDRDAAMIRVRQQLQRVDGSLKLDPLRLALATVICLSCRLRVKRWLPASKNRGRSRSLRPGLAGHRPGLHHPQRPACRASEPGSLIPPDLRRSRDPCDHRAPPAAHHGLAAEEAVRSAQRRSDDLEPRAVHHDDADLRACGRGRPE